MKVVPVTVAAQATPKIEIQLSKAKTAKGRKANKRVRNLHSIQEAL